MNRAVARVLTLGSLTGLGLCAGATLARALGLPVASPLAAAGVAALFATPPILLAVTAGALFAEGSRRHALAALGALAALLGAAIRAIL